MRTGLLAFLLCSVLSGFVAAEETDASPAPARTTGTVITLPRPGPETAEKARLNQCDRACGDTLFRCQQKAGKTGKAADACLSRHAQCEAGCVSTPQQ